LVIHERTRNILDRLVWAAHFKCRLPEYKAALRIAVPVTAETWREYWRVTRRECCGSWHGATGFIAGRLNISADEWERMISLHQSGEATCLGDSSHDYSYLVEAMYNR